MKTRRWGLAILAILFPLFACAQPLQVWLQQYGVSSQTGYHLIQTGDGNFAFCVRAPYSGDALYLLDADGVEIWHHTYGDPGNYDSNEDLIEMPDGGFLLAGYAWIDEQDEYDARLIRTDASGGVIWESFAGGFDGTDYGHGVVRTDDGRIFMTGTMWTGSHTDGVVWEFNDNGDLLNTSTFNDGDSSVGFHTIIITSDNNLVMSGGGYFQVNNYDGYVVKCDFDGNQIWENVLSLDYWQYMTTIGEAADGSFIFAGNGVSVDSGVALPWYGRLDATGNVDYMIYYGSPSAGSYFLNCTMDLDGNWLLAGRYEGADPHQDALLMKVDPSTGDVLWTLFVGNDDPGSDEGFSDLVILGEDSYMLCGDGDFGALAHPGFLAWYNATGSGVGTRPLGTMPGEFILESVYPNPFNASATINVTLPAPTHLTVDVINVVGQVIATVYSADITAGRHSFSWSADNLASGVYFVRATVPNQMDQVQKVMLLR